MESEPNNAPETANAVPINEDIHASKGQEGDEKEPNDSATLATVLTVGKTRTSVLTKDTDVIYYKVAFAEQTTVTLGFSIAQRTNKNTAFVLTIEQNGKM